jgi:hypothetical protein
MIGVEHDPALVGLAERTASLLPFDPGLSEVRLRRLGLRARRPPDASLQELDGIVGSVQGADLSEVSCHEHRRYSGVEGVLGGRGDPLEIPWDLRKSLP